MLHLLPASASSTNLVWTKPISQAKPAHFDCLESHTEHLWRCSYTTKLKKNIDYQDSRTSSLLVKSLIIDYQDSRTSSLLVKSLIWYTKEKTNIL